jgi:hypothetical protein
MCDDGRVKANIRKMGDRVSCVEITVNPSRTGKSEDLDTTITIQTSLGNTSILKVPIKGEVAK